MKKKILGLLLAAALVAGMAAGCVKEADSDSSVQKEEEKKDNSEGYKFAVFVPTMTNPYWVAEIGELEKLVEADGHTLDIFDGQRDQSKQISQVEDAISSGYDLFFISPHDTDGVRPALEAAKNAGIPTIAIDTSVADIDLVEAQVTADNAGAGKLAGEAVAEELGDKAAKVGILQQQVNVDCRDRAENFLAALKEANPNIEVVFQEEVNGTLDQALSIMDNMVQAHSDIDAIFAINDPSALGAVAAYETAGKLDEVIIASVDGSKDGADAVREGKLLGTAAQFPIEVASYCLDNAYKILNGETITDKRIKVPSEWIHKENCDELKGF